jgi:hypothetical protein
MQTAADLMRPSVQLVQLTAAPTEPSGSLPWKKVVYATNIMHPYLHAKSSTICWKDRPRTWSAART